MQNKSKFVGIFYELSKYLSLPSLISIYYSLAYPYFIYCSLAWGQTYATHLKPLIIVQKKVSLIIRKVLYNSHTNDLFFSNSILKLENILKYRQAVHKYYNEIFFKFLYHFSFISTTVGIYSVLSGLISTVRNLKNKSLNLNDF